MDSTDFLSFTDYNGYKVVGKRYNGEIGNGLKDKSLRNVVIPEKNENTKIQEIGLFAFAKTKIESTFISKYIKTIFTVHFAGVINC